MDIQSNGKASKKLVRRKTKSFGKLVFPKKEKIIHIITRKSPKRLHKCQSGKVIELLHRPIRKNVAKFPA